MIRLASGVCLGYGPNVADRRPASETDHEDLAHVRGALHDVSNALTVVLGWVTEARTPDLAEQDLHAALRMIEVHAKKARDLARISIGADVPAPASGLRAVDGILDDVLGALAPQAREAGVVLVVEGGDEGERHATCDEPAALHHVLMNLVMNALAHSPRGRDAHVRVCVAPGHREETLTIEVVDEGEGVPSARAMAIFAGASTREGGAGVGLPHSRRVARKAGGDLVLVSRAEAKAAHGASAGAVFRLAWPRSDRSPRPSASRIRGNLALAGLRFLVVEDDPAVTLLLEAALSARGAEVCLVRSHDELASALAVPHDGAIVDLSPLAGHLSEAFARVVSAAREGAPLILATGSVDAVPEEIAALVSVGAQIRLVRKPFELGEVLAALAERKPPHSL